MPFKDSDLNIILTRIYPQIKQNSYEKLKGLPVYKCKQLGEKVTLQGIEKTGHHVLLESSIT